MAAEDPPKQSRGVGDTVAKFTRTTRIDRLAPSSCGCAKRQAALNKRFPYSRRYAKRIRDVVPDERPAFEEITLPPRKNQKSRRKIPKTFRQGRAGRQWNKYRAIDGKNFKRDKMYPQTKKGLQQARIDAEYIRNNPISPGSPVKRYARILKFKDSYQLFIWPSGRRGYGASRVAQSNLQIADDKNPTSGEVDAVVTKFYRKKDEITRGQP